MVLAAAAMPAAAGAQGTRPPARPVEPNDIRPSVAAHPGLAVRSPKFEDFTVSDVYRGRPAAVDLRSDPLARRYRTRLRQGAAKGASFAGHYAVVTWGCGTSCERFALVDVRTGKAWISPTRLSRGAQYRVDSGLFVLNPGNPAGAGECGSSDARPCTSYLMMSGGRLVPLDSPDAHS
jgi:hypothetical protein